ncbi:MAG: TAT-variant-translocated molybdopterin oxidoreductase [Planctomycetota bacterium]
MTTLQDNITGQQYWQSLDEYANSPEFQSKLGEEFAGYEPDEIQSMSRRSFLKLAGASMALAGLTMTGCRRWPEEKLAPFANRPDNYLPGVPNYFASLSERGGVAHPMLVSSFDGRPIKVESHPAAGYATDGYDQALTLQQYDPERQRNVLFGKAGANGTGGRVSSWKAFEKWSKQHLAELEGGKGVAFLAEPSSSPTQIRLRKKLNEAMPQATWVTWEPLGQGAAIEGSRLALGTPARTHYKVDQAKIIACFDCDFLCSHPSALSNAKGWAVGRKSADKGMLKGEHHPEASTMNRMYVAEPGMTITGSAADERLPIKPSRVAHLLTYIAAEFGALSGAGAVSPSDDEKKFAGLLIEDLKQHPGESIIVVGANQPADVHALAHAINRKLGNLDKTITLTQEPTADDRDQLLALVGLVQSLNAGEIDTLFILGGNPVFNAPADLKFGEALAKAKHAVHLSIYDDETSAACEWRLPLATHFEAWGDGRWYDGTLGLQQPLILPIFNGRSTIELIGSLIDEGSLAQPTGYELVRGTFREDAVLDGVDFSEALDAAGYDTDNEQASGFEKNWRRALHLGYVPGTSLAGIDAQVGRVAAPVLAEPAAMEISFRESAVYDGRFANSAWLQEIPDALTKVVWDNPVRVSVPDAKAASLQYGDMVTVDANGSTVDMPVFVQAGQAEGVMVVDLGQGRTRCGNVGTKVGFDTYPLRSSGAMGFAVAVMGPKQAKGYTLATTSVHHLIEGFSPEKDATAQWGVELRAGKKGASGKKGNIIKEGTLSEYKHDLGHIMGHDHGDYALQLFDPPSVSPGSDSADYDRKHPDGPDAYNNPHAWGMTVDLTSCLGCSACVIACQSENNIPVVGKEQVWRSREMHWQRTDTYYKGKPEKPGDIQVVHLPVSCVQCENAPCEQVCPVAATVHDTEGLNTMVYNRCIGTRYCSNNCPYKVRRFNYFDYHAKSPRKDVANPWLNIPDTQQGQAIDKLKAMVFNPDVTVRMRGVMEKCTYCTQRIQRAKITRKNEWARNKSGEYGFEHATTKTVPDGTVVTACQDACPTDCISFGDLNDPESKVSQVQNKNKRVYALLSELNHRPRTKYLAKIRNPHPSHDPHAAESKTSDH